MQSRHTFCAHRQRKRPIQVSRIATTAAAAALIALGGSMARAQSRGERTEPAKRPGAADASIPPRAEQTPPGRFEIPYFASKVTVFPLPATVSPTGEGGGGGLAGSCPPVSASYTNPNNFVGNVALNLQAGMVETEIAAVTYTLPPEAFPVTIRTVEVVFGRAASTAVQTTNYSVIYYKGPPTAATIEDIFSSSNEPGDPPPIVIQPGGQPAGVKLELTVDPGDADQVVIADDGSHKFSIGIRIDDHNSSPTLGCSCGFGQLPAVCCPPTSNLNTFLTTDTDGHAAASSNWLWARQCPGATGLCQLAQPGWHQFGGLGMPTGDWVIRVTYEPFGCSAATGACCLNNGTQCAPGITQAACQAAQGVYRGDNTDCATPCPQITGACCINGVCQPNTTPAACAAAGGLYKGNDSVCTSTSCNGVCCVPSTQSCVETSQATCAFFSGTFQGSGSTCAQIVCFPMGACCLENGQCSAGPMSPAACVALGGTFAGHNTTCATANCQPPIGACCLGPNCAPSQLTQADCQAFGGTWTGPNSTCGPFRCPFCPGDITLNGLVNTDDLLVIIGSWGACVNCPADIQPVPFGNNSVNTDDLLLIIGSWGTCQ